MLNLFVSMAAINNMQTHIFPSKALIYFGDKVLFPVWGHCKKQSTFQRHLKKHQGHIERPLEGCVDSLLDRHGIAKAKTCVVSPPSHLYTSLILNYCCMALHWHAVIPAWIHTHNEAQGFFSLRGDRPVDQDKGFKLSKLSLLGVPQKVL